MLARRALRAALPATALAAALLLPFLGKAFTIDDPLFLYQARHLLTDPLHPTAFDVTWSTRPERMSAIMASGPGMAYLLVPCLALGGAEWAAHGVQLLAVVLAAWGTAALALRLGTSEASARQAALLLAATPAVLGMAGTAMPDVPAMAFGVWGIERAVAWSQERRWSAVTVSVVLLAAAILCRAQLAVLVGVAMIAGVNVFERPSWSASVVRSKMVFVAVPLVVWLVLFITRDPQASSGAVAGAAGSFVFAPAVARNVVSYFTHWTLVLPFALPWLLLHPKRIATSPVLYVATVLAWLYIRATPEVGPIAVAPAAGLSAAAMADLLVDAWRRRDGVQALLGLWMLTPLAVAPYLHLPSKYVIAAAPAGALAVARALAGVSERRSRATFAATLTAGAVLGVAILRADAAFANLGRDVAAEVVAPRIAAGRTVWFNGHWGFQWYAERAGARPLTSTAPHPQWGDLVVTSRHAEDDAVAKHLMAAMPQKRLVEAREIARPGGRLMSRADGAGFFSNGWGYLPWWWGDEPLDRYELWSIDPGSTP